MTTDYLQKADVWTVLDLIVAEFTSDPSSVACFDSRLVDRAVKLVVEHAVNPGADRVRARAVGLSARDVREVLAAWRARPVPHSTAGARVEAPTQQGITDKLEALRLELEATEAADDGRS